MFVRLISIEISKTLKHPLVWLELGLLVLIFFAYFSLRSVLIAPSMRNELLNAPGLEHDLQTGLGLFGTFSVLFYAAMAAVISAGDYPDRFIQMWVMRGVPRPLLLLARLCVILLLGLLLVTVSVFLILGLSALTRSVFLGGFTTDHLNWMQLLPVILRFFAASVPYLALTVFFAVISRSPLFAAGGTLVFATLFENILSSLSGRYPGLIQFIPSHLAQLLQFYSYTLDRSAAPKILGGAYTSEPLAFLTIAILLVVLTALALLIFSCQDLGGSA